MGESDRLVEIPFGEWPTLRDLFQDQTGHNKLAYVALDCMHELKKTGMVTDVKVYSLNGDWSDGTFVMQSTRNVDFGTLEESANRLETALYCLDWSIGIEFHPYEIRYQEMVKRVRDKRNLEILYHDLTYFHWISKEDAMKFELTHDEDVYISNLEPEHAELANSIWPHRSPGSEQYLASMIRNNLSKGVFGATDGDLRCWLMSHNNGVLVALHTLPQHVHKGYALLTMKAMARAKAAQGRDTVACVVLDNTPSLNLFRKLGFTRMDDEHRKVWSKNKPF